jgi:hypothetical protein
MNFDTIVEESHARLWRDAGKPGQDYLESLGIESQTWLAYKLGYRPDVPVPGTGGKEKVPAIVIPWLASGRTVGVRYRFLPPCKAKFSAETGSSFAGRFFGGQLVAAAAKRRERFLLLVEGEFNCMSIWQACGGTNMPHDFGVDVVSFGHESAKLSPAAIEAFRQFYGTFVWANRTALRRKCLARASCCRRMAKMPTLCCGRASSVSLSFQRLPKRSMTTSAAWSCCWKNSTCRRTHSTAWMIASPKSSIAWRDALSMARMRWSGWRRTVGLHLNVCFGKLHTAQRFDIVSRKDTNT